MTDEHLTRDLFRAIHEGWRNPGDLAAIAMAHLFELCPRCRREFESWRGELGEGVAAPEGQDYDAVFDRVRAPAAANDGDGTALEARVEADRRKAQSRAEELLELPPEQRLEWVRREKDRHSGLLLAEVLIEECRRRTPGHPQEGVALANLARVVLQHFPTSAYAVELYVLALARLANALRVIGDLPRADQVISDARYFLNALRGGDRMVRAELDSLEASLRTDQDRQREAMSLLLRSLTAYRLEKTEPAGEVACLMKLGRVHARFGDPDRALEIMCDLGLHAGVQAQPRLGWIARKNMASFLADAGRLEEARATLEQTRPVYLGLDDPLDRLRWAWTEAQILHREGKREAAESAMDFVRRAFEACGLQCDQALASVELARWYLEMGRYRDASPLIHEALPVFESLGLTARASAARELLVGAAGSV